MAFTLPDNDEAFNVNQSIIMQTDINAIAAGIGGDGVVSGCDVAAQGSPDMTLAVAIGVITIAGVNVAVTAGNVTVTAADGTNPRIDLVVVSNAGVKSVTAGTAAASPKAPDIPATSVLLAMVYVPANDTTIETNHITDKRNVLNTIPAVRGGALDVERTLSTGSIGIPGVESSSVNTQLQTANRTYYEYFEVRKACVLTDLFTEVQAAGVASSVTRLGVYASDNVGTIGALIIDAGTVACDSTGVKSITGLSTALPAGFYAKARNSTGAPTLRVLRGGSRLTGVDAGLGANPFFTQRHIAATIGAFPDPGTAPSGAAVGATPFEHAIFMKVT